MKEIKFCDIVAINSPYIEQIESAISDLLLSGVYIGGNRVEEFESEMAMMNNARFCIGVANGTEALMIIIRGMICLGMLKEGDKILIPANTCIASVFAAIHAGLIPVPVDVDPLTMLISGKTLEDAFESGVKAVMPVHLYGRVAWNQDIKDFISRKNLKVIEDNAQAIGAQSNIPGLHGDKYFSGTLGDAGAFSFYPTKNLGAIGDAGAIVTDNPELASIVRELRNYGERKRFDNAHVGYNSRLDPIQAISLIIKMPSLNKVNHARYVNAFTLDKGITNKYVRKPLFIENDNSMVWHQYVIQLPEEYRTHFISHMKEKGIMTDIHYPILSFEQPCFHGIFNKRTKKMIARELSKKIVSLPVNQALTMKDMNYICEKINMFQT